LPNAIVIHTLIIILQL